MAASDHLGEQFGYREGTERPGMGPRLHEIASHPDYDPKYGMGAGFYGPENEVRAPIEAAYGKPDHPVTVHRVGGPINPGDWVSLTPHYAQDFRPGQQVHSRTVPAKHVRSAMSDWTDEAVYDPS